MKQLKIIGGMLLVIVLVWCSFHEKEARRIIIRTFEFHSQDKEDIKNIIENAYLKISSGTYSESNDLPFYNQNAGTLMTIGFLPMFMLSGESNISPENINISEVSDQTAIVEYDLFVNKKESKKTYKIKMVAKKIGGNWKLDAQKFFPFLD